MIAPRIPRRANARPVPAREVPLATGTTVQASENVQASRAVRAATEASAEECKEADATLDRILFQLGCDRERLNEQLALITRSEMQAREKRDARVDAAQELACDRIDSIYRALIASQGAAALSRVHQAVDIAKTDCARYAARSSVTPI